MLTVIFMVVVPICAFLFYIGRTWSQDVRMDDKWHRERFFSAPRFGWGLMVGFSAFLAGLLSCTLLMFVVPNHPETQYRANLNILVDGTSTSSRYFLASGGSSTDPVFMFYQEQNGSYTLKQANADVSDVRYTTGTPYVEVWHKCPNDLPTFCGRDRYTFYVPEGSIKNLVSLDAKP